MGATAARRHRSFRTHHKGTKITQSHQENKTHSSLCLCGGFGIVFVLPAAHRFGLTPVGRIGNPSYLPPRRPPRFGLTPVGRIGNPSYLPPRRPPRFGLTPVGRIGNPSYLPPRRPLALLRAPPRCLLDIVKFRCGLIKR